MTAASLAAALMPSGEARFPSRGELLPGQPRNRPAAELHASAVHANPAANDISPRARPRRRAADGARRVDVQRAPLDDIGPAWERRRLGAGRKLVVVP